MPEPVPNSMPEGRFPVFAKHYLVRKQVSKKSGNESSRTFFAYQCTSPHLSGRARHSVRAAPVPKPPANSHTSMILRASSSAAALRRFFVATAQRVRKHSDPGRKIGAELGVSALRDCSKINSVIMAQEYCPLARRKGRAYPASGSVRSEQRSQRAKGQARIAEVVFARSLKTELSKA